MISSKQEQLIQKLLLKGQTEADIIDFLRKKDLLDPKRVHRVRTKIYEMKAAQAYTPPRTSVFSRFMYVFWRLSISLLGGFIAFGMIAYSASNGDYSVGRLLVGGSFCAVVMYCMCKYGGGGDGGGGDFGVGGGGD